MTTPRPRRIRLTLKMTLGIILLVALGLGRWINAARDQASALALIAKSPGSHFKYEFEAGPEPPDDGSGRVPLRPRPWWPPRALERQFGLDLFHNVAEVNLDYDSERGAKGEDALIAAVIRLRGLKVLAVCFDVNDARAEQLAHLPALEDLDLPQHNEGLTDRGMRTIGAMSTLKSLRVNHVGVTPAGLAALAGLTRLESLHSATMNFEPDERGVYVRPKGGPDWAPGLAPLVGLSHLKVLDIATPNLGGDALRHLGRIGSLKMIDLDGLSCPDDDLRHLAALPDLQALGLGNTTIDGTGFRHLKGHPMLANVFLKDAPRLADAAIPALADLPALAVAMLDGSHLTVDGLLALKAAPNLVYLQVVPEVDDDAGRLAAALPRCRVENGLKGGGGVSGFAIDLK